MTTSEIRRRNISKLAERSANFETDVETTIRRAEKAMTSFYRLAGFSLRKFYFENDGERYNERKAARLEAKETAWIDRVNGYLKEFNCTINFSGLYPSIVEKCEEGGIRDLSLTAWY